MIYESSCNIWHNSENDRVHCVHRTRNGLIVAGYEKGIRLFWKDKSKECLLDAAVSSISSHKDNLYLLEYPSEIGGYLRRMKAHISDDGVVTHQLACVEIRVFILTLVCIGGRLLLGHEKSLCVHNIQDCKKEYTSACSQLSHSSLLYAIPSNDDILLATTDTRPDGLVKILLNSNLKHEKLLTLEDDSSYISALAADEYGNIYLATTNHVPEIHILSEKG